MVYLATMCPPELWTNFNKSSYYIQLNHLVRVYTIYAQMRLIYKVIISHNNHTPYTIHTRYNVKQLYRITAIRFSDSQNIQLIALSLIQI